MLHQPASTYISGLPRPIGWGPRCWSVAGHPYPGKIGDGCGAVGMNKGCVRAPGELRTRAVRGALVKTLRLLGNRWVSILLWDKTPGCEGGCALQGCAAVSGERWVSGKACGKMGDAILGISYMRCPAGN